MESSSKYIYTHEAIIDLNLKQCSLPREVLQQLKAFHLLRGDPGPVKRKLITKEPSPVKNVPKGKEKIITKSKNLFPQKEKSIPGNQENLTKKKLPSGNNPSSPTKEDVSPVTENSPNTGEVVSIPVVTQRVPFAAITKSSTRPSTNSAPLGKQVISKAVINNNKENVVNVHTKPINSTGKSLLAPQTVKIPKQIQNPVTASVKATQPSQNSSTVQITRPQVSKPSVGLKPTSQPFKPTGLKIETPVIQKELIIPPLNLDQIEEGGQGIPKKRNAENDPRRLEQRQKQIEYGYKTIGYQNFISKVPKTGRGPKDPITPRKNQKCSKRSWDGQIRKWRRELHQWDPETQEEKNHFIAIIKETYGEEPSESTTEEPNDVGGSISEEEQTISWHAHASYVTQTAVESV